MRGTSAVLAAAAICVLGCGSPPARAPSAPSTSGNDSLRLVRGMPPLAVVTREGDPRGGLAATVATGGIADARGAEVAVALAAIVEGRLEGKVDAQVLPGWSGYRVRALVTSEAEAARASEAIRAAMLTPVADGDLAKAKKKLAALAARPMRDPALRAAVRCRGEVFGAPGRSALDGATLAELEAWRRAAHGGARVAFATVGSSRAGDEVGRALGKGGPWPEVTAPPPEALPPAGDATEVYDATGEVSSGGARATLAVFVPRAAAAIATAATVGDPRGPLASRLGALDAPAKIRDVVATAHARGGCLAVTIDLAARDLGADAPSRIATAVALARQELVVELDGATVDGASARLAARGAADPREAAERAAWWAIAADREDSAGTRVAVAIGVAGGREGPPPESGSPLHAAIKSALDRATIAWHEPVVESRTRIERGQGEVWVLVGSPCGTLAEAEADAGLAAGAALAMARDATSGGGSAGVSVEPYVTPDAIGLVAHGAALPGESATAHARRVADVAARAFAAEPIDLPRATAARGQLLRAAEQDDGRAMTAIALAISPQRPSWIFPYGTAEALGRSSDVAVALRASALRAGPLRVAALANVDAAQAEAAARATDRWVARRPGETRACPQATVPAATRPGTYPVETIGGSTEALLAIPLPAGDAAASAAAGVVAMALDGPQGLLASALGEPGLARSWSARVVGGRLASALVVRVATAGGALDAAVAQTRALLDRLRQGALTDSDFARAGASRAAADLASSLDPRARVVALFRGEPAPPAVTLESVRAFAAAALRDDALVIVAARPRAPRTP